MEFNKSYLEDNLKKVETVIEMTDVSDPEQFIVLAEMVTAYKEMGALLRQAEIMARIKLSTQNPKEEGAVTRKLDDGRSITITKTLNRTIKAADVEPLKAALNEAFEGSADEICSTLLKWKPELSVSALKGLSDSARAIVEQHIETKEGPPTVEINEPKVKK